MMVHLNSVVGKEVLVGIDVLGDSRSAALRDRLSLPVQMEKLILFQLFLRHTQCKLKTYISARYREGILFTVPLHCNIEEKPIPVLPIGPNASRRGYRIS